VKTVLPLTYLGNTDWFGALCGGGDVVIDLGEHYVKQTYRNRCEVMTAGGVSSLTVDVVKGGSKEKKPVREMRIDGAKRWRHRHRETLVSAYGNSPFFDHYWERFAPCFEREWTFLADLNMFLLETALGCLRLSPQVRFSDVYVEAGADDVDFRGAFEPLARGEESLYKKGGSLAAKAFAEQKYPQYHQVFSDRHPFSPNLSIIDLIFCEGPSAAEYLS
jgi:hypothetical protein